MANEWIKHAGKHVDVYAHQNSYAAKRAHIELRSAERTCDAFLHLLPAPAVTWSPIEIYLSDPVPTDSENPATQAELGEKIVRIVRPESPGEPIALALVPLLVARSYGRDALSCGFIDGIAGYVAGRIGENATVSACDEWVRLELSDHRPVSVLPRGPRPGGAPGGPPGGGSVGGPRNDPRAASQANTTPGQFPAGQAHSPRRMAAGSVSGGPPGQPLDHTGGPYYKAAATSFVAFLVRVSGKQHLHSFLKAYDSERRDQAALAAFQQPLAKLEETWLGELRRAKSGPKAIRAFVIQLLPLLKPYRWRQAETIVYMLLSAATSMVLPFASKTLIDILQMYLDQNAKLGHGAGSAVSGALFLHEAYLRLGWFAVVFLALNLVNGALNVRQSYVTSWIGQKLLTDLQEKLFTKLQYLSHNFYATAKVGDMMTRLYSDLSSVQQAITQVLGNGISQSLVLTASVSVILYQTCLAGALPLGILILLTIPLFLATSVHFRSQFRKAGKEQQQRVADVASSIEENLSAQAVIKALGLEQRAVGEFHERLMRQLAAGMRLVMLNALTTSSVQGVMLLGQLLVLCVGGYYVLHNPHADGLHGMTLGRLILLTQLLPIMLSQISGLANVGQAAQQASGALERVAEVFNAEVAIADKPNSKDLNPLSKAIRIDGIDFNYGGDRPILHGLSIDAPAGSHIAIVGASGSGKSTVVNLLMRFWDPDKGRVLFDDQDLRDISLQSLRGQIGLVFQDTFVFDTTLRDNIAIARPGASDTDIGEAADKAQLGSLLAELPQGFDTLLGERGARLSGGQRQRIAIARAMLRDPRILILDEATSALDAHTEAGLMETLAEASKGRTTITITHRLATAASSDRIFVLEAGNVVEQGTHEELVEGNGPYQRLWDEQRGAGDSGAQETLIAARMKRAPLFAHLDDRSLAALAQAVTPMRFAPRDEIVAQGDPGDRMFLIGQGEADVVMEDAGGFEHTVNHLRDGDFFGEMSLFTRDPRTATVRATGPILVYSLMADQFQSLIKSQPGVREGIERAVAQRASALATLYGSEVGHQVTSPPLVL